MDRGVWRATIRRVTVGHDGGDAEHSACESSEANEFDFPYL